MPKKMIKVIYYIYQGGLELGRSTMGRRLNMSSYIFVYYLNILFWTCNKLLVLARQQMMTAWKFQPFEHVDMIDKT